ncbi:unnamed protein product [marine sediment metagenome]|uniref:Band 7 domain-containing protein n=3 Tax=marine sediment metagenome TaxID=412755 RepID=X1C3R0_9ZZZZ
MTADKPPIDRIQKMEIGFKTIRVGPPAVYQNIEEGSLMLTGDINIVDLWFIVQYRIKDAKAYLFNIKHVKRAIKDAAEAAMRQTIGDRGVDEATKIYAQAYEQDPNFFNFLKTLETYQQILPKKTLVVVPLESKFFKYLTPEAVPEKASSKKP